MSEKFSPKVGLLSRIDYGSEGFREGLLIDMAKVFQKQDIGFAILLGGLISKRSIQDNGLMPKGKDKDQKLEDLTDQLAFELSERIPFMHRQNGDLIKIYIVLSPAYDGDLGRRVAEKLATRRPEDISVWNEGNDRFPLKGSNFVIGGLTPEKNVWMRGDFYSTSIQRVIKDFTKRSGSLPPSVNAVGGFGVNLNKPIGEEATPYVGIPVLHKIRETTMAENQVGFFILHFNNSGYKVYSYSAKDLLAHERELVPLPENLGTIATKILKTIQRYGQLTAGQIAEKLQTTKEKIEESIQNLKNSTEEGFDKWPGIHLVGLSGKYDFNLKWIQRNLRYGLAELLEDSQLKEDRILAFGCMHAGSVHTDYHYFTETLPAFILEEEVDTLVGAGDFIEGLKHDLMLRGEIIGNANYTQQEKLAAHMVAKVILKVFETRFKKCLSKNPCKTERSFRKILDKCLLKFVFIPGNHCSWTQDEGFTPLDTFEVNLRGEVFGGVEDIVVKHGCLFLANLLKIVSEKIIRNEKFETGSGLKTAITHPYMSRTKTQSIRVQEAFGKFPEANIVIVANFHVGIYVQEHSPSVGERCGLQVGTIKLRSSFEDHKLKTVDHGVGLLVVQSLNGRIIATQNEFFSKPSREESLDNDKLQAALFELIISSSAVKKSHSSIKK